MVVEVVVVVVVVEVIEVEEVEVVVDAAVASLFFVSQVNQTPVVSKGSDESLLVL